MSLSKKYPKALITGASSGLGRALAIALANEKVSLILTGRAQEALSQIASYLRSRTEVTFFQADLSTASGIEKVEEKIHTHIPELVINNAAIGLYGDALTHSTEEQIKILDVNCRALTALTLESTRTLLTHKKKGSIVNISSVAGFSPYPSFSVYAASKSYVNIFSQSLDKELKSKGIRVFTSCPGQINTQFGKRAGRVKGKKYSNLVITQEDAACHVLYQLRQKIPLYIFNWKYRVLLHLQKILPQNVTQNKMQKEIRSRIDQRKFVPTDKLP